MKKFLIILSVIAILFLMMGSVAAEDITIEVGCKHITGSDGYADPLFLISTTDGNGYYKFITADYLVSAEDYYKINVGDTVKLHVKANNYCEIVNTKESKGWW